MGTVLTRRQALAGGSGLVIGLMLPLRGVRATTAPAEFAPNAFLRIAPDDTVTVLVKHIEFGQGTYTGYATLVAEELDAAWEQMRAEAAPSDPELYKNYAFGIQGTGGSTAIANGYTQMREAGAMARAMLVAAAAALWGVPSAEISVSEGRITHPAGHESGFGALASAAAGLARPSAVTLKDPSDFRLIGTDRPKLDTDAKSTGQAEFTIDVTREGMLTVAVLHPPKFGATLASFDATAALAVPGVERVEQISSGVAVYGRDTWAAFAGRAALTAEWDETGAETRSSAELERIWTDAVRQPAAVAEESGDLDAALAGSAQVLEAEYVFPYLAHAALEPLDAVVELKDGEADIWTGSQIQTVDHQVASRALGLPLDKIRIHTMLTGGSFGRRAHPDSHMVGEACEIARTAGGDGAYKMLWTRENDMLGGYYRPLTVHRMRGGLDAQGNITAWENTIANQSIVAGTPFEMLIVGGIDATSIEGSSKMPYDWPSHRVSWARMEAGVPVLWWRSVGHTHTAYATEVFLDELLVAGGKDPVAGRLELLKSEAGRDRAVLERVADMAGWAGPQSAEGRTLGVALHESFNTYVAMIAEVSDEDGSPRVHRVWTAVDCGVAVNPNVIRMQIEGGVGYGLGAALTSEITLGEGGAVDQSNFDGFEVLRIDAMPKVEVSIIESAAAPSGIGEPGTPPIAPAVGNAWRALTGEAPSRLPFSRALADRA